MQARIPLDPGGSAPRSSAGSPRNPCALGIRPPSPQRAPSWPFPGGLPAVLCRAERATRGAGACGPRRGARGCRGARWLAWLHCGGAHGRPDVAVRRRSASAASTRSRRPHLPRPRREGLPFSGPVAPFTHSFIRAPTLARSQQDGRPDVIEVQPQTARAAWHTEAGGRQPKLVRAVPVDGVGGRCTFPAPRCGWRPLLVERPQRAAKVGGFAFRSRVIKREHRRLDDRVLRKLAIRVDRRVEKQLPSRASRTSTRHRPTPPSTRGCAGR